MNKYLKTLGLMSGTSMDGLDLCLSKIYLDKYYNFDYEIIDYCTFDYDKKTKTVIQDAINGNQPDIDYAHNYLGQLFARLSKKFIDNKKIDLIGSHGQTISHLDFKYSNQIGSPSFLSEEFQVPIVYNFRQKDIDNGGNGAPLVPFLDFLLFKKINKNIVTINIGGIANTTIIKNNESMNSVLGFDTGPGMCLIDAFCRFYFDVHMDFNAEISMIGHVDSNLLKDLLDNKFIKENPPKSACITQFTNNWFKSYVLKYEKLNRYDFLRTLVEFTAISIFQNITKYIKLNNIDKIFISGGGKSHILLFQRLEELFKIDISNYKNFSINSSNKESFLMTVLAVARYFNINSNMMNVTGAKKNISCGEIYVN